MDSSGLWRSFSEASRQDDLDKIAMLLEITEFSMAEPLSDDLTRPNGNTLIGDPTVFERESKLVSNPTSKPISIPLSASKRKETTTTDSTSQTLESTTNTLGTNGSQNRQYKKSYSKNSRPRGSGESNLALSHSSKPFPKLPKAASYKRWSLKSAHHPSTVEYDKRRLVNQKLKMEEFPPLTDGNMQKKEISWRSSSGSLAPVRLTNESGIATLKPQEENLVISMSEATNIMENLIPDRPSNSSPQQKSTKEPLLCTGPILCTTSPTSPIKIEVTKKPIGKLALPYMASTECAEKTTTALAEAISLPANPCQLEEPHLDATQILPSTYSLPESTHTSQQASQMSTLSTDSISPTVTPGCESSLTPVKSPRRSSTNLKPFILQVQPTSDIKTDESTSIMVASCSSVEGTCLFASESKFSSASNTDLCASVAHVCDIIESQIASNPHLKSLGISDTLIHFSACQYIMRLDPTTVVEIDVQKAVMYQFTYDILEIYYPQSMALDVVQTFIRHIKASFPLFVKLLYFTNAELFVTLSRFKDSLKSCTQDSLAATLKIMFSEFLRRSFSTEPKFVLDLPVIGKVPRQFYFNICKAIESCETPDLVINVSDFDPLFQSSFIFKNVHHLPFFDVNLNYFIADLHLQVLNVYLKNCPDIAPIADVNLTLLDLRKSLYSYIVRFSLEMTPLYPKVAAFYYGQATIESAAEQPFCSFFVFFEPFVTSCRNRVHSFSPILSLLYGSQTQAFIFYLQYDYSPLLCLNDIKFKMQSYLNEEVLFPKLKSMIPVRRDSVNFLLSVLDGSITLCSSDFVWLHEGFEAILALLDFLKTKPKCTRRQFKVSYNYHSKEHFFQ